MYKSSGMIELSLNARKVIKKRCKSIINEIIFQWSLHRYIKLRCTSLIRFKDVNIFHFEIRHYTLIGSYSSWFMRASNFAISVAYEFNSLKTDAAATRIKFNERDLMITIRGDSRFNRFALWCALVFWKIRILWWETIQRVRRCASLISVVFIAANKRLSKTCFIAALLYRRKFTRNMSTGCV